MIQLRPKMAPLSEPAVPSLRESLERWLADEDVDLALKIGTVTVGRLCVRAGELHHAELPGAEGDDAVRLLPRLVGTSLVALPPRPAPSTVTIDWRATLEFQPSPATTQVETRAVPPTVVEPPEAESFEELFKRATQAYIRRDRELARGLFRRCLELKPDDTRTRHNLEKLEDLA